MVSSLVIVGLLFAANIVSDREHLENLEFETGDRITISVGIGRALAMGPTMAAAFAGPKNFGSFIKIISTIVLSGPRLFTVAWRFVLKARRLKETKTGSCAKIISSLIKQQSRISFVALSEQHPTIDFQAIIPQLEDIDGVVFLMEEPPGLTVASRLLEDFQEWKTENP